jgi:hypothetical protein
MEKLTISAFNDSYSPNYFSDVLMPIFDNSPNANYYLNVINKRFNFRVKELESNTILKDRVSLLKEYLFDLRRFSIEVVKLYEIVNNKILPKNSNEFNIQLLKVKGSLEVIKNYTPSIKKNIEINEIELAIRIKNYLVDHLKEFISILDSEFYIHIKKSPLKKDLKEVYKKLNESIDAKEIQLLKIKTV